MGESKLPIYAYVDETGNTGHNLFDSAQPDFFTSALITKGDFDISFSVYAQNIARKIGVESLHGTELGIRRIEAVANDILRLLSSSKAHFFVSRVEKRYLLATKMFDSLFDSGENAAVSWHHYNVRPLRLILAFKLAGIIDEDTAKLFWQCILEEKKETAYAMLPRVCESLQRNIGQVPDEKSRQVLGEGLEWARTHPEAIQIHIDRKIARQGHFPNMVAFANLLDGLENYSKRWKKRVARITHDRQSEFQQMLTLWHEMYSNASSEEIRWAGETYTLQKVVGSQFEVKEDSDSSGIQVTDVILWLYSQFHKGKSLPVGCGGILEYVFAHGWESDFSFSGVEKSFVERFGSKLPEALSTEQEEAARALLEKAEKARLASMAQYEQDRIPPFLRRADSLISDK